MTLTPLYTLEEINAEIAQAKRDLAAARQSLDSQHGSGNGALKRVSRDNVANLQKHLEWLQGQRAALQVGPGAQAATGRPAR